MALETIGIVSDLAVIMIAASVLALISHRLRQPLVLGYIAAGLVISPFTFEQYNIIQNTDVLNLFADLGVILLLFIVGIEFPLDKLKKIGFKVTIIAVIETFATFAAGYAAAAYLLQFSLFDSLFLGLAVSVMSTIIVSKVLEELGIWKQESSFVILGVAIVEDIILVSALGVLQSLAVSPGEFDPTNVGISIALVTVLIVGVLAAGSKIVPSLIDRVGRLNNYDLLLIAVLGLCFALAFIAHQIGVSVAIGAFLAGVLVAESRSAAVSKVLTTPIKDMFSAMFFVSIGALINIKVIPTFLLPVFVVIIISFAAKFTTTLIVSTAMRIPKRDAIKVAFGLAGNRGGEMSLVAAKGGTDVGATSSIILPMVGTITIIGTFLTPYIIKFGWKAADRMGGNQSQDSKML